MGPFASRVDGCYHCTYLWGNDQTDFGNNGNVSLLPNIHNLSNIHPLKYYWHLWIRWLGLMNVDFDTCIYQTCKKNGEYSGFVHWIFIASIWSRSTENTWTHIQAQLFDFYTMLSFHGDNSIKHSQASSHVGFLNGD
jgi:hypothetical protein